eukprot:2244467-Amphidinium_carterae.1
MPTRQDVVSLSSDSTSSRKLQSANKTAPLHILHCTKTEMLDFKLAEEMGTCQKKGHLCVEKELGNAI